MPNDDSTSALPTTRFTTSRSVFHEDDYTHPCHPFYVHPSDVLGSYLVSVSFDGTGYGSWRRTILVALSVRNKLDFINGYSVKPHDSSPLARHVEYSELAKDIWSELEERYGQTDVAKKKLAHISQGSLDIASYFNKIKRLWDEIDALSISRVGSCSNYGFKSDYQKDDDVQKHCLEYIVVSDEKQRHVSTSSQFLSTSASFNAGVSKQGFPSRVNFDTQRALTYKYCKKPCHTIDRCYKLHGYPSNFKFTKGPGSRKTAAHVEVNSPCPPTNVDSSVVPDSVKSSQSSNASMVPGLTQDQFSQLMMLLQQSHVSADSSSTPTLMASANFAGPFSEDASGF
ncbi:uncharacterized protein [Nicotiana tomentosiformis]|uniref:uncharacterized protein n=1 Tax=Nicotiana tomentosiformis TaxID=4098 RepID=UPI00388C4355